MIDYEEKLERSFQKKFDLSDKDMERLLRYGGWDLKAAIKKICNLSILKSQKDSKELAMEEVLNFILNFKGSRLPASQLIDIYRESCRINNVTPLGRNTYYEASVNFGLDKYISTGNQLYMVIPDSVRTIWRDKEFEGEVEFTFNLHNYDEDI